MTREILITGIGRVLQIIITLASVRVFTSLLSSAEVGNVYLINSIVAFFGLALINPVGSYMTRKLHVWQRESSILRQFRLFNGYLLCIAVLSLLVVFLIHHVFGIAAGISLPRLLPLVMLLIYATSWNQMVIPSMNILGFRICYIVFYTLTLAAGLLLSVVLVQCNEATAFWWLGGQLASLLVVTLGGYYYFRRHVAQDQPGLPTENSRLNLHNMQRILLFVAPLGITTALMWFQNQSYRLIIEKNIGLEFLGMMGLGLSISSNIATALESFVSQLYYPVFYREISTAEPEKRAAAWNRMGQLTLPLYIALALMVTALAPFLATILVHRNFGGIFQFIMYGAWIEFFRMTASILTIVAHAEMETRSLVRPYLCGGILALAGVFILSRLGSYEQTIPSVLILSGIITMAVIYFDMKKLMPIKVGIRRILLSMLVSLPFVAAVPFYHLRHSFVLSVLVVSSAGVYFLVSQYMIAKPLLQPAGR